MEGTLSSHAETGPPLKALFFYAFLQAEAISNKELENQQKSIFFKNDLNNRQKNKENEQRQYLESQQETEKIIKEPKMEENDFTSLIFNPRTSEKLETLNKQKKCESIQQFNMSIQDTGQESNLEQFKERQKDLTLQIKKTLNDFKGSQVIRDDQDLDLKKLEVKLPISDMFYQYLQQRKNQQFNYTVHESHYSNNISNHHLNVNTAKKNDTFAQDQNNLNTSINHKINGSLKRNGSCNEKNTKIDTIKKQQKVNQSIINHNNSNSSNNNNNINQQGGEGESDEMYDTDGINNKQQKLDNQEVNGCYKKLKKKKWRWRKKLQEKEMKQEYQQILRSFGRAQICYILCNLAQKIIEEFFKKNTSTSLNNNAFEFNQWIKSIKLNNFKHFSALWTIHNEFIPINYIILFRQLSTDFYQNHAVPFVMTSIPSSKRKKYLDFITRLLRGIDDPSEFQFNKMSE